MLKFIGRLEVNPISNLAMRQLLTILLVAFSLLVRAQNLPVKNIKISLPANPDAKTSNWSDNSFSITATAREISPDIQTKLLVVIKKNGAIACGAYNSLSAPKVSFNAGVKTWSGKDAAALLMEECALPPGDYELSVQFFGYSDGKTAALSEEKIKKFSIKSGESDNGKNSISLNIGGIGVVFGGRKQTAVCGTITSFTKVTCAGTDKKTGLPDYAITVKMVNKPVQKDKACTFILNSVTALSEGNVLPNGRQNLPLKIASNDSVSYSFIFTPASLNSLYAKFSITGNWNGDAAATVEMEPALTLQQCAVCGCGSWTNLTVGNAGAATKKFECGDKVEIPWKCGQPFSFSCNFQCAGAVKCDAVTAWQIQKDGVSVKTGGGNNINDSFIPTDNGIYSIILSAACGSLQCQSCTYTIIVKDCKTVTPPPVTVPEVTTVITVTPPVLVVKNTDTAKSGSVAGKYYYDLDTEPSYAITEIFDKTLNVQFTNSYASVENIKVNIYNSASGVLLTPTAIRSSKLFSTTGLNRMTVNLSDYKLEQGRPYYFMVSVYSTNYHLKFKIMADHEK